MKRLKFGTRTEVRKALTRIANYVVNGVMDIKTANTIAYISNIILGTFDKDEVTSERSNEDMRTDRQTTIGQLLRAAEITGDSERRERYLDEADRLIRQELSSEAISAAKKAGILKEE